MYPTYGEGSQEPYPDSPAAMSEENLMELDLTGDRSLKGAMPSTSHADFHEQEVELMQQILDSVSRLENRTEVFLDQHYSEPTNPESEEKAGYASRWEECHAIRMELLNRIGKNVEQITRRFRA